MPRIQNLVHRRQSALIRSQYIYDSVLSYITCLMYIVPMFRQFCCPAEHSRYLSSSASPSLFLVTIERIILVRFLLKRVASCKVPYELGVTKEIM
jgi:hypothetical protein